MDSKLKLDDLSWRGCPMNEIYRNLSEWELKHAPQIRPSDNHTVLYHWPLNNFNEPPKPRKGHNKWDAFHVRLPCSSKNQYPVTQSDGSINIENRWLMIEKALLKPIKNSQELETAILSYNSKYQNIWKFRALHKMFEEELEEEETMVFFEDILPKIIRLALRLPEIVTSSIPLLKQEQNRSISMSQQQVACLLANAFLCTFPRRNTTKKKSEYSSFPDINFNRLFQSSGHQVIEKIKCITHYFRRVCNKMPTGVLTFIRRSLSDPELPNWDECDTSLSETSFHITSCGTIEDQGHGLLQVDFANKFLGGGVLGSGCVQEEIRFVICPELIISKLFTEALKPCEALLMIGCEQFSKYTGYASSFRWDGNFDDKTPFDDSGRRKCHIVAIDALYFAQSSHQYREELILRELNKAYVGFIHPLDTPAPGVASGNWGCGAFGGEASLKALIQLMACTVTKRPLVYFTFGNRELRDNVYNMYNFFIENNINVKQLWKYLKEFHNHKLSPNDLYSFIIQIHRDNQKSEKSNLNSLKINEKIQSFPVEMPSSVKSQDTIKTMKGNNTMENSTLSRNFNDTSISMNNVRIKERSSSPEDIDYFKIIETYKTNDNNKKPIINSMKNDDKNTSIISSCKNRKESFKNLMLVTQKFDNTSENEKVATAVNKKLIMKDYEEITSIPDDEKLNVKQSNDSSSDSVAPKKSNESLKTTKSLKQKTLLDMFDVFYTGGERPAKRYCVSSNQEKK